MNEKRIIFLVVLVIIAVFAFIRIGNFKKVENDNYTYNKNRSFLKKKEISGITFNSIECYYDGHDSFIKYVIANNTKEDIYLKKYDILVKDDKENIISTISVDFSQNLKSGDRMTYKNQIVGVDLSNAKTMEIKAEK